ncbi:MAG: hypothetical protein RRA94_01975 [Bacteroidota bacterium]|nr:hypothetical protein [Bacteroidota bacterium]
MNRANLNTLSIGIIMTMALLAAPFGMHAQSGDAKSGNTVQVGTYDVEAVFQQHPANEELNKASQSAQAQMQAAQQEGNQQKMQQLQQEFEQSRGKVVESFYQDVNAAMPVAAKAADVKLVVAEVSYAADGVETKDITSQLIAALDAPKDDAAADAAGKDQASLEVGTYDLEAVFRQHPANEELSKASQAAQAQMQAAQQEGDQQKMQQVQQEFEQTRGKVVENFYKDINKKLPSVAAAADIRVVAVEVSYAAKDVKTRDITSALIEGL